jgi:hypothetical protein
MRWLRKLRTYLGRVIRDVARKIEGDPAREAACAETLERARRIHGQRPGDADKLYAFHAPEVECIARGKARARYEFGVKEPEQILPVLLDKIDLHAVTDETAERGRNLHARREMQAAVPNVAQARREAESEQGQHAEHMVGRATGVGEVLGDAQPATVGEQAVQYMGRLRRGGGDHLGVERAELIGDVGVECDARLRAVAGVDVAPGFAAPAGAKELAVRAGCASIAPEAGERQGAVRVDDARQRVRIALLAHMPVMGPGELAQAGPTDRLGHPREAKIDAIGENGGEKDGPVLGGHAAALVGERGREAGPVVDLQQQIGDLDPWQEIVGGGPKRLRLVRGVGLQGPDLQDAILNGDVLQSSGDAACGDIDHRLGEDIALCVEPLSRILGHADRQGTFVTESGEAGRRQQSCFKAAEPAAAGDPDVAGAQAVAEFEEHADFPGMDVERLVRPDDEGPPALPDKACRRISGDFALGATTRIRFAKHCHGPQKSARATRALEGKAAEHVGCEQPQRRPSPHELGAHVDPIAGGEAFGLGDGAEKPRPADGLIDGVVDVAVGVVRRNHGPTGAREGPEMGLRSLERCGRPVGGGALGLSGDAPQKPVEHHQSRVRQFGLETERPCCESCASPGRRELPQMLGGHEHPVHRDRVEGPGRYGMLAPAVHPQSPHDAEPLDESAHAPRTRRGGKLAKPCETGEPLLIRRSLKQRLQRRVLIGREIAGKRTPCHARGGGAGPVDHQLKHPRLRQQNAPSA